MQIDQLYQEIILDHYKHPHGRGLREPAGGDCPVGEAHHVNPTCGDEVTVRVVADADTLADISYDGAGCSISQASASVLYELLNGRSPDEAFTVHEAFVELLSGRARSSRTRTCSVTGWRSRAWRAIRPGSSVRCCRGWRSRTLRHALGWARARR